MARATTKRSPGRKPGRSQLKRKNPGRMQSDRQYQRWYLWKVYDLAQTIWREIDPALQYMAIQTAAERVEAAALQTQLAEQAAASRISRENKRGWAKGRDEPLTCKPILQPILQPPTIRPPSKLARLRQKKQNLLQQIWAEMEAEETCND